MAMYDRNTYGGPKSKGLWIYPILALLIAAILCLVYWIKYHVPNTGEVTPSKTAVQTPVENPPAAAPRKETPPVSPLPAAKPAVTEASLPGMAKDLAEPNAQTARLIEQAVALVNSQSPQIFEARDRLNDILSMPLNSQQRSLVKDQLSQLSEKWLFSRTIFPQDIFCTSYKVKPGDSLATISAEFKVPYEIIMQINDISRPETLQAGEIIKVIKGPFNARIYRSAFTMDLYLQQNMFVRTFKVGLGKAGKETPTGLWLVDPNDKLISPTWTDPDTGKVYHAEDSDYPLGSRWIGLEGIEGQAKGRTGFAIHGTKDPQQIGAATSRGCVRLHNGDAILVYNLMMPGFSQVKIVD
jgi:LysM repeat protein